MKLNPVIQSVILVVSFLSMTGCGGTLRPLYADYRIDSESVDGAETLALVERAVEKAGWTTDEPDAPNVISTEEETVSQWGLYKLVVSLDVVPINNTHVRVYVHPYRVYFWGSRSKMLYMTRRVRNHVLPRLSEALVEEGVITLDVDVIELPKG